MKKIKYIVSFLSLLLTTTPIVAYENSQRALELLNAHIEEVKLNSKEDLQENDSTLKDLWKAAKQSEYPDLVEQAEWNYQEFQNLSSKNVAYLEQALEKLTFAKNLEKNYPNFNDNPRVDASMKKEMAPYLIPQNHPIKPILDQIFSSSRVIENADTLVAAGFKILHVKESSRVVIAKHPAVPGYLFKLYLDSNPTTGLGLPAWECLTRRCKGIERIRKLMKAKKLKHFAIPDKYLYPLPPLPTAGPMQHPVVLVVTDMKLTSLTDTKLAWLTIATKEHLKELHYILKNGAGSWFLTGNVPYTKDGKFTFIDTEYPKRKILMHKVKDFINPELHEYWDNLVKKG